MYTIELDISNVKVQLIDLMKQIGKNNDFEVFHHGSDRLVFKSDRGLNYSKLIRELDQVCQVYDVTYMDLLV